MRVKRAAKATLKWLAGSVLRRAGVVCLNYHRIGDGQRSLFDRGLWSATAEEFDRQLRWLKAHFDVITPSDLPEVVRARRGRKVLVTFDDGYLDNYTVAYPILRTHGLPATFFVVTGFVDDGRRLPPWDEISWMVRSSARRGLDLPAHFAATLALDEPDRELAIRAVRARHLGLPCDAADRFLDAVGEAAGTGRFGGASPDRLWMTWDMLREMRDGGMTIGGHTVNHPMLSRLSRDEQWKEISGCGRRIADELGEPMRVFSYPFGKPDSFNADTRACLREAGVRTAFTYHGGFGRLDDWDDYDVPRSAIEQDTTFHEFRAEVMAPWLMGGWQALASLDGLAVTARRAGPLP